MRAIFFFFYTLKRFFGAMLCNGSNHQNIYFSLLAWKIKNYQNDDNKFHTFRVHREVIHTKLLHLLNHAIYVYQGINFTHFFAMGIYKKFSSFQWWIYKNFSATWWFGISNEFFVFTKKCSSCKVTLSNSERKKYKMATTTFDLQC